MKRSLEPNEICSGDSESNSLKKSDAPSGSKMILKHL